MVETSKYKCERKHDCEARPLYAPMRVTWHLEESDVANHGKEVNHDASFMNKDDGQMRNARTPPILLIPSLTFLLLEGL